MNEERKCTDCGSTRFVEDRAQGDIICGSCGLVAESHVIDERSEWRTFADKDKDSGDPNRVGNPNNPLLDGGGLTTVIARSKGDGGMSFALNRMHNRGSNPDRALQSAFNRIKHMCEQLSLTPVIKDQACEIYKDVSDSKQLKGRGILAICAACLYLACRQEGNPRTFKEITAAIPELNKKEVGRCFKDVVQLLKDKATEKRGGNEDAANHMSRNLAPVVTHAAEHLTRFCNTLNLDFATQKVCKEMAYNAKPTDDARPSVSQPWDGKSPISIAAAILYIVSLLSKDERNKVTMQHICTVTQVADVTVKAAYKDLYPAVAQLLPKGFATAEEIAALPPPIVAGGKAAVEGA